MNPVFARLRRAFRVVRDVPGRTALLEDALCLELKVVSSIYGEAYGSRQQWAQSCMTTELATSYLRSWSQGRKMAWKHVEVLANELRLVTGDDDSAWDARLVRLEILSDTPVDAGRFLDPTTMKGLPTCPG